MFSQREDLLHHHADDNPLKRVRADAIRFGFDWTIGVAGDQEINAVMPTVDSIHHAFQTHIVEDAAIPEMQLRKDWFRWRGVALQEGRYVGGGRQGHVTVFEPFEFIGLEIQRADQTWESAR